MTIWLIIHLCPQIRQAQERSLHRCHPRSKLSEGSWMVFLQPLVGYRPKVLFFLPPSCYILNFPAKLFAWDWSLPTPPHPTLPHLTLTPSPHHSSSVSWLADVSWHILFWLQWERLLEAHDPNHHQSSQWDWSRDHGVSSGEAEVLFFCRLSLQTDLGPRASGS